ncbi:hypothetical protein LCGC14_0461610 [marine sediment metagenome]|uniref:RecF/RecN/SMC N-terminal domain-containing protein n=1 Tax=marine sediment metagenome TaxID=412755 RepID=A0A0F9VNS0_9ZZZZ
MSAQLRSVAIKNFKVHEDLSLEFGLGTTVLVGPNGAGKTSIAEAIAWCLWGAQGVQAKQQKRLIRYGAEKCRVEVVIALDGLDHLFVRELLQSGGSKAWVETATDTLADSSSGVQQYLESLGLDLEGFSVQYAAQKELDYFVFAIPSVRKKLVASLFRLEDLDGVIKAVRMVHADYAQQCLQAPTAEMVEGYATLTTDALDELDGLKVAAAAVEVDKTHQAAKVEELRAAFSGDAVRERTALEADVIRFADIVEECEMLAAGIVAPEVPDPQDLPSLEEIDTRLAEANEEARACVLGSTALSGQRDFLAENRDALDGGKCPLCLRGIRNKAAALEAVDAELGTLTDECAAAQVAAEEANRAAYDLAMEREQVVAELQAADRAESEAASATARKKELEEKRDRYKVKLAEVATALEQLPEVDDTAERDLRAEERQLDSTTQAHGLALGRVTVADRAVDEAAFKLDKAEKELRKADRLRVKRDTMETLTKALPDFRDSVMAASLGWVADRATRLLYGAAGRDWRLTVNEDLEFHINGNPLADFSTGQVDTVCVCLRIAIAEYLSKRIGFGNLMILDGVLDRIDEDNRDALGMLLGEINVDQVLVLSHFDIGILDGERIEIGKVEEVR